MSLHVLISTHGLQTKVMKKYFIKSGIIEFIDLSRNQIKYIEKESFSNLSYLQVFNNFLLKNIFSVMRLTAEIKNNNYDTIKVLFKSIFFK